MYVPCGSPRPRRGGPWSPCAPPPRRPLQPCRTLDALTRPQRPAHSSATMRCQLGRPANGSSRRLSSRWKIWRRADGSGCLPACLPGQETLHTERLMAAASLYAIYQLAPGSFRQSRQGSMCPWPDSVRRRAVRVRVRVWLPALRGVRDRGGDGTVPLARCINGRDASWVFQTTRDMAWLLRSARATALRGVSHQWRSKPRIAGLGCLPGQMLNLAVRGCANN
jgi:hypothetical protein